MNAPSCDVPTSVVASTLNQRSRFAAAYSVLEKATADHAFPGAAFGVLLDGNILALDSVGRFTYEPDSTPVLPTTIYDLASVTKVVATTSTAMLLYDRGKLDLDRPLGDILPGFIVGSASPRERWQVTIRSLLAHCSGLPAYVRLFETAQSATALLDACLQMPLDVAPGIRAEYSDIGFILLGQALEVIAEEMLDVFSDRQVFAPLGMATARYRPPPLWHSFIPPTENDLSFRHRIVQGEVHDENCFVLGGVSGHAGVFSNVFDLLLYAKCILSGGKLVAGRELFRSETINLFASRQNPQPESSRALGWDTPSGESSSGRCFSRNSIGHLGYTGTSMWLDLDNKIGVVLATNRTWPDRSSQEIRRVRPAFYDAVFNEL